jgi:hypothetical protein
MLVLAIGLLKNPVKAETIQPPRSYERMAEWTVASRKAYLDPFNDVDVDVVFTKGHATWRVPMFWRGGQRWTVRFAPPAPGIYTYRLQSTDPSNSDLNGHEGRLRITPYHGPSEILRRGMLRVSPDGRHFEYSDGTPFLWLGDTWWQGLSDRLDWAGFQKLARDRKRKGFTLVQTVAGLVPYEELAPSDPGFANEGGAVWTKNFERINPAYFDAADRRIELLLADGIVPAIVGAWRELLPRMGSAKMKKHWRYIIARWGAYPVVWIAGGEVDDPPAAIAQSVSGVYKDMIVPGWTDIVRYVRNTDPYHHPLTVHESSPPFDMPLQNETSTDFDLLQSSHTGWSAIAVEVAQVDMHYARTSIVKPVVEGEIGYEKLGGIQLEDFQRTAFWLSMLNGAAGHTYGADGVFEAYTDNRPLHRTRYSFLTWEEGMSFPGSYQVGLGAKLLRQFHWWRFAPHPEWVAPRGTTLLEPRRDAHGTNLAAARLSETPGHQIDFSEDHFPGGEWSARGGSFRAPYAAGIPGEVRFIYLPPQRAAIWPTQITVLGLEKGVRYSAYWWKPDLGMSVDLGTVELPGMGEKIFESFPASDTSKWSNRGDFSTAGNFTNKNVVVTAVLNRNVPMRIMLRLRDKANFIFADYSPSLRKLGIFERVAGKDKLLGQVAAPDLSAPIDLKVEARENFVAASVSDGTKAYATPIEGVDIRLSGAVGIDRVISTEFQGLSRFEVRRYPDFNREVDLRRSLFDAEGRHRGDLLSYDTADRKTGSPTWNDYARKQVILLDSYLPESPPAMGDWLLVMRTSAAIGSKKMGK